MNQTATLFVSTFTTLLAIINPLDSLPVFLHLGKDERAHRRAAAAGLHLRHSADDLFSDFRHVAVGDFEVPLSMVRIVGGIILMRIGFSLFQPSFHGVTEAIQTSGLAGTH